jgi:hypothetical protein
MSSAAREDSLGSSSRLRDQCLNRQWFKDQIEARAVIERAWAMFLSTIYPNLPAPWVFIGLV